MFKNRYSPILVCTAERTFYRPLVTLGTMLAREENRPLSILAVEPRELVTPDTAENIQILHNLISGTGAEITVLFSDSPILSFSVFAKQKHASHVIVDEDSLNGELVFRTMRDLLPEIPLSILSKNGQLVTFPAIHEMHTVM